MIYSVRRIDDVGYDEYKGFVVRAKSEAEALEICREYCQLDRDTFREDNTEINEVLSKGKSGVILDSFLAG